MSMAYRKSAAEILEDARVGSRPGYFSGRGVTTSDLDGIKLQRCHEEIRVAHGDEAAAAFVDMVASLDRMTATGFINAVYALEAAGWTHAGGDRVRHIEPDSLGSAFATVVDTFGRHADGDGRLRQEMAADYEIRRGFLQAHGYTDRSGGARHCHFGYFMAFSGNEAPFQGPEWVRDGCDTTPSPARAR